MKTSAEKARERVSKWQKENPEKRKEIRDRWVANNLEKMRAMRKRWKLNNTDKVKTERAEWMRNHPEVRISAEAARRSRKNSAGGKFTKAEVANLFALQRECCALCKAKLGNDFHRDHIMPIALGGTSYIDNIQLLCPSCNSKKGSKDPIDYANKIGALL